MLIVIGIYISLLSILGGGNTVPGPTTYLLMTATCLFVGAVIVLRPTTANAPISAYLAMALIVITPLLQIIPLPPAIWQALPGSALRADVLALIGQADLWRPLSLEPLYTAQTFVMASGFAALVIGLLALKLADFERVLILLLGLICAGILVGVIQVATNGAFPRFFKQAHDGALIGFFANKNHMAMAIAASLPLASVLLLASRKKRYPVPRLFFFVYWTVALIATLATASRAGIALYLIASLAIALSLASRISIRHRILIATIVIVVGAVVISSSPFQTMMDRFDHIGDDNRVLFTQRSLPLVTQYWPTGAGGGVFEDLFITSEPIEWVKPTIMNHVHNDYVEMVIEYGLTGVIALLVLAVVILGSIWELRRLHDRRAAAIRVAGAVIIALMALHSLVDYPLRRPATLAIFAVAIAMVLRRPDGVPSRPELREATR
ncbi:O-antigen ligase family protein [Sphingomonas sp. DT-207]